MLHETVPSGDVVAHLTCSYQAQKQKRRQAEAQKQQAEEAKRERQRLAKKEYKTWLRMRKRNK